MERGESAGQSYCRGNWLALPDQRAHDHALRLARMHPVIALTEGEALALAAELLSVVAGRRGGSPASQDKEPE